MLQNTMTLRLRLEATFNSTVSTIQWKHKEMMVQQILYNMMHCGPWEAAPTSFSTGSNGFQIDLVFE